MALTDEGMASLSMVAQAHFLSGRYSETVRSLDAIIMEENCDPIHYSNRAAAYLHLDMLRKALQDCNTALEMNSRATSVMVLKVTILAKMGKTEEAQKERRKLFDDRYGDFICLSILPHASHTSNISQSVSEKEPEQAPLTMKEAARLTQAGFQKINEGDYLGSMILFDSVLEAHPNVVEALVGRGTAKVFRGEFTRALEDFSRAISVNPNVVDAWVRRAQTYKAHGDYERALQDCESALDLLDDCSEEDEDIRSVILELEGTVLYHLGRYIESVQTFEERSLLPNPTVKYFNGYAVSSLFLGNWEKALELLESALQKDSQNADAWMNLARTYKEAGFLDKSLAAVSKSESIRPSAEVATLKGQILYGGGRTSAALEAFRTAVSLKPEGLAERQMQAVCLFSMGALREAVEEYDALLQIGASVAGFYQRECAMAVWELLDTPLSTFSLDSVMDPHLKLCWAQRKDPNLYLGSSQRKEPSKAMPAPVSNNSVSTDIETLVRKSQRFGQRLQYRTPGFFANERQHRALSCAIVEIGQTLRTVWRCHAKGQRMMISSASSSSTEIRTRSSETEFGWRDLMDIAVKWRQYSEPNDPVWWVDGLTQAAFSEGFGSQTPLVNDQTHVIRYYPYFDRCLQLVKELGPRTHKLDDDELALLAEAKSCGDLHGVFKQDFYVTTPCLPTWGEDRMEGTRLTQQKTQHGFIFSIRTPGTPKRWVQYDVELRHCFEELREASLVALDGKVDNREGFCRCALRLIFYWYNFMPLSRGTAGCGLVCLQGMLYSAGLEIDSDIPSGVQLDWEAILVSSPDAFVEEMLKWILPKLIEAEDIDTLPRTECCLSTIRHIMQACNFCP